MIEIMRAKIASLARPSRKGIARSAGKNNSWKTATSAAPRPRDVARRTRHGHRADQVKTVNAKQPRIENARARPECCLAWDRQKIAGKIVEALEHAQRSAENSGSSGISRGLGICVLRAAAPVYGRRCIRKSPSRDLQITGSSGAATSLARQNTAT